MLNLKLDPKKHADDLVLIRSALQKITEQNFETAFAYLEPATQQNINLIIKAEAQSILGEMYFDQKNYQAALTYLQPAADQNENQSAKNAAQTTLGRMYFFGLGVQKNQDIALRYLLKKT